MLQRRRAAAQQVADCLIDGEAAIDTALAAASGLVALLPTARLDAGVAAEIGQDAIEHAMKTANALVAARGGIVEAHRQLAKTRYEVGLRAISFGGLMPKASDLQVVPTANAA